MAKVLLIDDNWQFLEVTKKLLKIEGHEAITASDGKEGLEILAQTEGVDIIFCDYNMIGMKGGEFARELRTNPKYQNYSVTTLIGAGDFPVEERDHLTEYFGPMLPHHFLEYISKYIK